MKRIHSIRLIAVAALLTTGIAQNAVAASTMVTDAVGTQELWTFQEVLGAQKLVSKINQVDGKGINQTWDANGNRLSRTDAEGRTTTYTYNATNQKTSMIEASGTPQARTTDYQYVNADIDLVTKTTRPSIYPGNSKETINSYDANLNITAVTVNGFDIAGAPISRSTTFAHDQYGKVIEINGPRIDVDDITTLEYYDCNTGAECGQLKKVTNALGQVSTFDSYDGAARLLQSTDTNGVITTYTYHPRGWMLSSTQTPPTGVARITTYEYDKAGQLIKTTMPDGIEQHFVYDAAHDLREITDNLGNKIEYTYDAKGNRTHELTKDSDGTLVRSAITDYDIRNFIESINNGGSITQLINDAVGNLSTQTDPNLNPSTEHSFDALDRLNNTVDALTNTSGYQYDVADQLIQVQAANGATTQYEYDDLGNQSKEISPDRGTLIYTHDAAGNVTGITDDRGITVAYSYDALNRLTNVIYPDASENISYRYDSSLDDTCGFSVGRLCQVIDESGQTDFEYDPWGNTLSQGKVELGVHYQTRYQYDAQDRVIQMSYPNGRVVDYQRDVIGRIIGVTTMRLGETVAVLSNRSYRADHLPTGHTLGNGLVETRRYDTQGRAENIQLSGLVNWDYAYDANGNILSIDKPQALFNYDYDVLDRLTLESNSTATPATDSEPTETMSFDEGDEMFVTSEATTAPLKSFDYEYDANGNRVQRNNRSYAYQANSNTLIQDGSIDISQDEIGNILNLRGDRSLSYNNRGRLRTVSREGILKATYRYNAFNQRSRKEIPDKNTQVFHYDINGNVILRSRGDSKPVEDYIWVDGQLIQYTRIKGDITDGTIREIKAKTFITNDHLSTPRLGTNESQTKTWEWITDAFNKKRPNRDPDADGNKVNLKIGFPGQYYDAESGLYYNWNRYYDRKTGRYVTSDPIGLDGSINTYGYVDANPLKYSDPNGLVKWTGTQSTVSAGLGGGAVKFEFNFESECINGQKATAEVIAGGFALSAGIPASFTYSREVTAEDNLTSVNPSVFQGSAKFTYASWAMGFMGASFQWVKLGGASILGGGFQMGWDTSVVPFGAGISTVVKSEIKNCECE